MNGKVSVIVPVYKVEPYIDKCISSITGQTYDNLEIILVINLSEDKSDLICEQWRTRDSRIQCIYPEGRGLGNARNVGIENATGEYVCFIDSDDWIDSHYVERLLGELISKGADIVDCNYCKAFPDGSFQYSSLCTLYKYMHNRLNEAYDSPCAWRNISRLSLWKDNGIRYTNTIAEDLSIYSLVRGVAKGISHIDDVLYYYRVRNDSLTVNVTADKNRFEQLISVLEWIVFENKKRGIFDEYKNILFRQAETHLRFNVFNYAKHNADVDYPELKTKSNDFLRNEYDSTENIASRKSIAFGSYNLGRINNYLTMEGKTWEAKYCFSSTISVTSQARELELKGRNNEFRNIQVQRDFSNMIWDDLNRVKPDYLLWDCLEEINGVIEYRGSYITNSEILKEYYELRDEDHLIEFGSDVWWGLWKESVSLFINRIKSINSSTQIVLVKTRLSGYKGTRGKEYQFDEIEKIEEINDNLDQLYKYIENTYSNVRTIDMPDNSLYYSDENFEYGCSPKHLNSALYAYVGMMISEYISLGSHKI